MEVAELIRKLNAEWVAFKADNDRRLKEVEKNGRADPLTEEKIQKHSLAIGELEKQLNDVVMKVQRRGAGGGEQDPKAEARAAHRVAYEAFIRHGKDAGLRDLQVQAAVSPATDSDKEGGYTVPHQLDSQIEKYERDGTPMRQACRVITVSNENYEKLVQQGKATSGWVGEREARPVTDTPTWALLSPYFGEIYAKPEATQKMLDDSALDIEAWLAEEIGLEFAEEENTAFTVGNGVKKPKGFLSYTLNTTGDDTRAIDAIEKMVSASAGGLGSVDKLIDLVHKLHPKYRQGAVWMMSNLTVAAARKLKDGAGTYVFQPSFLAGAPSTILGYPIVENEDMPDPAADSNSVAFGNFQRAYTIVDVRGTRVLRDPFTNKPYVVFYTTKRMGGFLVNNRAIKVLTLSA